jgi:seryl-tRNA synthetase
MGDQDKLTDRVLRALEGSTEAKTEMSGHIKGLEKRVDDLEEQMGTMNAHLDNIAREASQQTLILRDNKLAREAREKAEADAEEQVRQDALDLQKQRQKLVRRVGAALWDVFKTPLATLLTAIVAWLIYWYFWVPS